MRTRSEGRSDHSETGLATLGDNIYEGGRRNVHHGDVAYDPNAPLLFLHNPSGLKNLGTSKSVNMVRRAHGQNKKIAASDSTGGCDFFILAPEVGLEPTTK